jgi:hypothetical protein
MTSYLIYCAPGSGGLFLASVFAKIMNIPLTPKFSCTGNCHDLGRGEWRDNARIQIIGDHWEVYQPGHVLYYAHSISVNFLQTNPKTKIVLIDFESDDVQKITQMYVQKAWPALWSFEEYSKWAGPSWPEYSRDNISASELIRTELINDLAVTIVAPWIDNVDRSIADFVIPYKTVMGVDQTDLGQIVSNIVGTPLTPDIDRFISDYQTLNKKLYFET